LEDKLIPKSAIPLGSAPVEHVDVVSSYLSFWCIRHETGWEVPGMTDEHNDRLIQFVLDGSDENGTRFLLRFSEDNMNGSEGVVFGRSPGSSPYIINHLDISRKHFCLKKVKGQIFIEDLRSTNGTSLNGRAIGNKGPAVIDSGDQITIGSVVMTLRVLGL
jgi:hypothetical protein